MRMSRRIAIHNWGKRYLVLFDNTKGGDQTDITGGWTGAGSGPTSTINIDTTITCIHKRNDSEKNNVTIQTVNTFPFEKYSKLHVLSQRSPASIYQRPTVNDTELPTSDTTMETVIDISGITDATRIVIKQGGALNISSTLYTYIYKIWLEK